MLRRMLRAGSRISPHETDKLPGVIGKQRGDYRWVSAARSARSPGRQWLEVRHLAAVRCDREYDERRQAAYLQDRDTFCTPAPCFTLAR